MELVKHFEKMGIKSKLYTTSYIDQIGRERTEFFEKKYNDFLIYRFHSFIRFREYRISLKMIPYILRDAKNIDIFHSHAIRSFQEDICSIISIMKKKPLIITPHGSISTNWDFSDKIPKMIYDKTIGYFKKKFINLHFIAVAKSEIPIIKRFGIDDDHVHYIPNGVNTEIFKPIDSKDLKRKIGLENFDIILYVGRIAKGKGVDKLIKILKMIVNKNKKIKLIIIGEDAGYLPIVKSLIQKYNLFNHVIITGYIPNKNLPKYYSMADIIVYPSRQEIFGLVLCEAGACGKAVIGSNIMGPKEIIVDGKTGYTSDFKDLNKVSELIIDLLNDKNKLIQMGKNGCDRVKKKYSWDVAAKIHLNLYKKVLEQ